MNSKTVLKRFLPVLLILVVIVCAVVIFSKCSTKQTVPYGSVGQNEYFSYKINGETITVSDKEIYDRLRYQSYEIVVDEIEKAMFKDYIEEVKNDVKDTNSDIYKDLIKQIDTDCFNTSDKQAIAKLDEKETKQALMRFYDNLQNSGYDFVNNGVYDFNVDNLYTEKVFETYYLSMAKTKFAKEKLLKDIEDVESDYYVDFEEEYESEYDGSKQNKGDIEALIVKFDSRSDAQKALMELQLKFNKGLLYYVPRGSKTYKDYETFYNTAKIGDKNGSEPVEEIDDAAEILLQYVRIYNATYQYKQPITLKGVTLNQASTIAEVKALASTYKSENSNDEQLAKKAIIKDVLAYDEAYELDSEGNTLLNSDGDKIVNDKLNKNVFRYTYNELNSYDSTMCNYVYNTLAALTYETECKEVSSDFYDDSYESTPREQSASSGYFLAYKFMDCNPLSYNEIKRLAEKENADQKWVDELAKIQEELKEDIIDSNLTTTYMNAKVNELYKEIYENEDLLIFDPLVQTFYKFNNSDYTKTNKKSDTNVLSLNYTYNSGDKDHVVSFDLTAENLFARLNKVYGASTAYDIATGKILESLYKDKITTDVESDLNEELETLLASFSQGGMESSGYPASIGKQVFLQVYLNVDSSKEAIEEVYKRAKYEEYFEEDLEKQASLFKYSGYTATTEFGALDNTTDDLYKVFAQLAKKYYDDYAALKYRNILVYTDFNGDGKHDDPADYKDDTTTYEYEGETLALYDYIRALTAELMNVIITEVNKAATIEDGLTDVNADYEQASKYSTTDDDEPTKLYGKFKKAGLKLTIETEASSTNKSSLVKPFLDNIDDFYNSIIKDDQKDKTGWKNEIYGSAIKYTSYYDSTSTITTEATRDSLLETEFGYHALYVTGFDTFTSTKWNYETDNVTLQGEKVYEETYNNPTNDYATVAQIKTYVEDYADGYEKLPSKVQSGLQASFQDEYTKFTNTQFRSYMMHLLISQYEGSFKNAEITERNNSYIQSLKNSIDSYDYDNEDYQLWWSMFE